MHTSSPGARGRLNVESLEQRCLPSSSSYVSSLYTNLLNRPGSAPEVAGYVAQLDGGVPAVQVANAFVTSDEYLGDEIQTDYQIFLRRATQPAEVQGWLNLLKSGHGEQDLKAGFLSSGEFFANHDSDYGIWVKAAYPAALGRDASPAEVASWTNLLQHGVSLQTAARDIVMSPESAESQVTAAYEKLLGRAPDPDGLAHWSAQLENGMSPGQLNVQLAASPESINLQGGLDPVVIPCPPLSGPDAPTGEVYPGTGFVDPGPGTTPDLGNTPPDAGSTSYDPGNTSDPGTTNDTGYDPVSVGDSGDDSGGDTGDTGLDPGCGC